MGTYLLFFVFGVVMDVLAILWNYFRGLKKPYAKHGVAVVAVMISFIGLFSIGEIAEDRWLIAPELLGTVAGSYLGMYVQARMPKDDDEDEVADAVGRRCRANRCPVCGHGEVRTRAPCGYRLTAVRTED